MIGALSKMAAVARGNVGPDKASFSRFKIKNVLKKIVSQKIMENLRVIRVKVVAPEKLLDVNTFPKNNPNVDFTIYVASKYLCVDMASCNIQKYFMLI